MDWEMLEERARIIKRVRSFFDDKNYLETDTPLLSPDLIPESCLEVFETTRIMPGGKESGDVPSRPYWLVPSPEIWMKKLIAQHRRSIYQICKCFRNGESQGHLHSPEFTMLEYYTMDAGYLDSLALTEELFASLVPRSVAPAAVPPAGGMRPTFERITVADAFTRWAGFDLFAAVENGSLESEARSLGLAPAPGLDVQTLYDLIFIHTVEPNLKGRGLVALMDYPAFVPVLAKKNGKTAERWELYANGIELANCYSEETDPEQVRQFFATEAAAKESSCMVRHRIDPDYWKIFQTGFPRCSGVALGLDRLIMYCTGRSSIDSVLAFAE